MKHLYLFLLFSTFSLCVLSVPVATDVKVLGSGYYNTASATTTTLTGYYWYRDDVNDEDGSTYKWFRDGSEIIGETDIRYTLTALDDGCEISFQVTPISTAETGDPATSDAANSITVIDINDAGISDISPAGDFNATLGGIYDYMNLTLNGGGGQKLNISGGSVVNVFGDLTISNASLGEFLINGGTLNIYGQLIITTGPALTKVQNSNNSTLNIMSGVNSLVSLAFYTYDTSTTNITGNLNISGSGSDIKVNGNLTVDGSFVVGASSNILVDGDLAVMGDFIGGTGSSLTGNGSADIYGKMEGFSVTGPIAGNLETNLPIELVYFKASDSSKGVLLAWQTATEENNDYFTLERSIDGISFEIITTIVGAGNSSTLLNYSYTDTKALTGTLYYRLKQTDYNGDFSYSDIVSVNNTENNSALNTKIIVSPSPYQSGDLKITNFGITNFTNYTVKIIDITGKTVYSIENIHNGSNSIIINPNADFIKGYYIVTVQTPTTFGKTKLLIE